MTTKGFDFSLLCSLGLPSSSRQFKPTARSPRRKLVPVKSSGKITTSSSLVNPSSSSSDEYSNGNDFFSMYRRGLVFTATLPFLLPLLHESIGLFSAKAADERLIIKESLRKVLSKGKAAGVLRLVFHDAGTYDIDENSGGMNGSIVFELDRPESAGLKKSLKILEKAKSEVDTVKAVSWADMIAMAGAEAVLVCGGPLIPVSLGRVDSMVPDLEGKLPEESLDAYRLKQCFQRKGFSTQELVALSGAHTLGSKGFGDPTVFDNSYFKILLEKPWMSAAGMSSMIGLPSDRALAEDDDCLRFFHLMIHSFKLAVSILVQIDTQEMHESSAIFLSSSGRDPQWLPYGFLYEHQ